MSVPTQALPDAEGVRACLERYFREHPSEFAAVYLFGSVARGAAGPNSDVDVALLCEIPPPSTLEAIPAALETDLTRAVGRPVQLVMLDTAPADLVHRVLRDGIVVEERNRSHRVAFEIGKRNEYFDLLPILRRYREPRHAKL
ncbi:MAG TPA: nucleotidyltransferase domain-containing protein [Polyangiaceae bacterium]